MEHFYFQLINYLNTKVADLSLPGDSVKISFTESHFHLHTREVIQYFRINRQQRNTRLFASIHNDRNSPVASLVAGVHKVYNLARTAIIARLRISRRSSIQIVLLTLVLRRAISIHQIRTVKNNKQKN